MDFSNININLNNYIPNININIHTIQYIIFYFILIVIVSCLLFIICSYCIIKIFNIHIDDYNILFYNYNTKSRKLLQQYGNCKINKIYLTRQPFGKFLTFILNIISMYEYDKLILNTNNIFLRHNSIMFEIQLPNGQEKLLFLEKNNSINMYENFIIHNNHELKRINLNNNNYTINSILNATQERIGNHKFFNWHIYKNNCKGFIKEILKTIGKYNKTNKNFICYEVNINTFVKTVIPSEFTKHIINSSVNISNMFEKYIYDTNIFN